MVTVSNKLVAIDSTAAANVLVTFGITYLPKTQSNC